MGLDFYCFDYISSLCLMQVNQYPKANTGSVASDLFGIVTPDAPIVALLASYLGLEVGLISNDVGNDLSGKQLTRFLERLNVRSTVTNKNGFQTPYTVVISDLQNTRTWFAFLPAVKEHLLTTELAMLQRVKLAYVDFYAVIREASIQAIQYANQYNTPLFVNLAGDPLNDKLIGLLYKSNTAVVQTSSDNLSGEDAKTYLLFLHQSIQPRITILTLADKGAFCVTNTDIIYVPAFEFQTIHSNGAGAAFSAGFAYAYLQNWNLDQSMRFASVLGGLFCTVKDGFGKFSAEQVLHYTQTQ